MPDLIVNAGSCDISKASKGFNIGAEDATVHCDTHNLHRQAQKIKETITFQYEILFDFFRCGPPNRTGASSVPVFSKQTEPARIPVNNPAPEPLPIPEAGRL